MTLRQFMKQFDEKLNESHDSDEFTLLITHADAFDNLLKDYWKSLSIADKQFYDNNMVEFIKTKYQQSFNIEVEDGN